MSRTQLSISILLIVFGLIIFLKWEDALLASKTAGEASSPQGTPTLAYSNSHVMNEQGLSATGRRNSPTDQPTTDSRDTSAPRLLWAIHNRQNKPNFEPVDTSRTPVTTNQVRVMYRWFGRYPRIETTRRDTKLIAGGIPQRVVWNDERWARHTQIIEAYLNQKRPNHLAGLDTSWAGYAIIDFEWWSPLWEETDRAYRKASIAYEREKSPEAPLSTLRARAQRNYERAAREFLVRTLQVADSLRPRATWGYYGFPHPGRIKRGMSTARLRHIYRTNDRLEWLYDAQEAIFPSIYLTHKSVSKNPGKGETKPANNCYYIEKTLEEAFRVSEGKPVVPFTRFVYHSNNSIYGKQYLDGLDLELEFVYPFAFPISDMILWGKNRTKRKPAPFKHFVTNKLRKHAKMLQEVLPYSTSPSKLQQLVPAPCLPATPSR